MAVLPNRRHLGQSTPRLPLSMALCLQMISENKHRSLRSRLLALSGCLVHWQRKKWWWWWWWLCLQIQLLTPLAFLPLATSTPLSSFNTFWGSQDTSYSLLTSFSMLDSAVVMSIYLNGVCDLCLCLPIRLFAPPALLPLVTYSPLYSIFTTVLCPHGVLKGQ